MKIKLSDEVSLSLQATSKRQRFKDTVTKELYLAVQPTGKKAFYFAKSVNSKMKWIKLGEFPEIDTETARRMCASVLEDKSHVEGITTLGGLYVLYFDSKMKHCKTCKKMQSIWNRHYKQWEGRPAAEITRLDVQTLHNEIGSKTPVMANRALEILKAVYNFALDHDKIGFNPAQRVKKHREQSRTRYITKDEMPKFLEVIEEDIPSYYCSFFKILLFTGARSGVVKKMRFEDVDRKRNLWTIPGDQCKNGDEAAIVLCDEVITILFKMNYRHGDGYVFPANSKSGHLESVAKVWKEILKHSGLKDLQVHDLRRTLGSWQAEQGDSLKIIQETLTHRSEKSTQVYARVNKEPVRNSVDKAVGRMMGG